MKPTLKDKDSEWKLDRNELLTHRAHRTVVEPKPLCLLPSPPGLDLLFFLAMPGKEKYPELTGPPEVAHCRPEQLLRGANKWMVWWDCQNCRERISDHRTGEPAARYYSLPPRRLTPGFDPLRGLTTVKAKKMMERPPTPPLDRQSAQNFRNPKEQTKFTAEEERVLAAAREILNKEVRQQQPTCAAPAPQTSQSSSSTAKRAAPAPPVPNDPMEEEFHHVMTDAEILRQCQEMETLAARLRASLGRPNPL